MFQKTTMAAAVAISTSLLLVACGGSNGDNNGKVVGGVPSTLIGSDPTPTLTAASFGAALSASGSAGLLGTPKCDISITHIRYATTGAAGEATTASGALMVPTGSDPSCVGKRPVVLYAHGTTTSKSFNMASLTTDPTNAAAGASGEGTLAAAAFAAQGYIVIAPNYAGYDTSTLSYHPYLNYKQQSQEMIDALRAGRAALPTVAAGATTSDSGKLFVTGYSQGGYVAMAAMKAMDAAHIPVTAGAPMSGPYSMAAFGDAIFYGSVPIGATQFAPLLTTGYQKAYGNLYSKPSDAYQAPFADNIETLLTNSFPNGSIPPLALFQGAPTGNALLDALPASSTPYGFAASGYLVKSDYRAAYLADAMANPDGAFPKQTASPLPAATPANTLRQAFKLNDLRGYIPSMPTLMCGGVNDPTVFFLPNTELMAGVMGGVAQAGAPVAFASLDVDPSTSQTGSEPFPKFNPSPALGTSVTTNMSANASQLQSGFALALQTAVTNAPSSPYFSIVYNQYLSLGLPAAQAGAIATKFVVATQYHGMVAPFCSNAARTFFQQY